mgnify:CR=1 FL=1
MDEFSLTELEYTEKDTKIKVSKNNISINNQSISAKNDLTKKILGLNPHVVIQPNSFKIDNLFIKGLKDKFKDIKISKRRDTVVFPYVPVTKIIYDSLFSIKTSCAKN